MKWLLLLLLTVNVVLFGIQLKESERNELGVGFVAEKGVKGISLLKEGIGQSIERPRCLVIGELADNNVLGTLGKYLAQNDISYEVVNNEEVLASQFWVYVKAISEMEESVLRKKKIEHFLIGAGELEGAYSLGLFKNVDLAKALVAELKESGIIAEIKERRQVKESLWLSLEVGQIVDMTQLIEGVKALNINVGEIKEFFCKSIASEK